MNNATNAAAYPTTNVSRGTTRVRITFGRSNRYEIFEKGSPSGVAFGDDGLLFVPEHIRHDVKMRCLTFTLNDFAAIG